MKLAQFKTEGSMVARLGVLVGERLFEIGDLAQAAAKRHAGVPPWLLNAPEMLATIRGEAQALGEINWLLSDNQIRGNADERAGLAPESVDFLPPVYPSKIIAIGRNYIDHAIEGGSAPPEAPLIFNKLPNSLSAHNAPIILPAISTQVDFEAELAVVIGRKATRVAEADAFDYVFGYTLLDDVSARDLQFGDGQWTRGKSLDTFAPLGPFITTRDEIADVQALKIEGILNGEVMQSSNTGKMIFKVAHLVSYISQGITLEPGDVIATGTPDGVGIFRTPPVLLKAGDVFEVRIEGLGTLRNPVISAA